MALIDPDAVEYIPTEAASTYAKLAAAYGQEYYRSVANFVSARLRPGDRLLDAGTGPGFIPLLIAERTTDVSIDAFDFTEELLRYGREKAARQELEQRVSFLTADCYSIPTAAQSYQTVLSTGVLHSLDEPVVALDEFHRVLEPGGTAWVFDPAILDVPDDPDLELTEHEESVFQAYGIRTDAEEPPITTGEAEQLIERSSFGESTVWEGTRGDIRISLIRCK